MTSALQKIVTPGGETLIVLPEAEYEALLDAADIAAADKIMADIRSGKSELIPGKIVDRLLDGENRIRVWREHATELAAKAEISGAYLSELETGKKTGTVDTLRKLATALNVDLDDLVP